MGLFYELHKLPTLNELKGSFGEQLTKYFSKVMTDTLILHDVLIDGENDLTSQIDLLMIGVKGIYVVEVKMYSDARIYGDGRKCQWYYYRGGKKIEIYSPLKQNQKHIQYLKKFLEEFGEVPCFSVLTIICEDFKITNINEDPEHVSTVVCSSLPAMIRGLKELSKGKKDVFSDDEKQKIYNYILENQYIGKEKRIEHKEKLKEIKKNQKELHNQIQCPYCKSPLVLRKGRYGDFYGCSNFPKCRYTQKQLD